MPRVFRNPLVERGIVSAHVIIMQQSFHSIWDGEFCGVHFSFESNEMKYKDHDHDEESNKRRGKKTDRIQFLLSIEMAQWKLH